MFDNFNGIITADVMRQLRALVQSKGPNGKNLSHFAVRSNIAAMLGVSHSCVYTWERRSTTAHPVNSSSMIPRIDNLLKKAGVVVSEGLTPDLSFRPLPVSKAHKMDAAKWAVLESAVKMITNKCTWEAIANEVGMLSETIRHWYTAIQSMGSVYLLPESLRRVNDVIARAAANAKPPMTDPKHWIGYTHAQRLEIIAAIDKATEIVKSIVRIAQLEDELKRLKESVA